MEKMWVVLKSHIGFEIVKCELINKLLWYV